MTPRDTYSQLIQHGGVRVGLFLGLGLGIGAQRRSDENGVN